MITQNWPLYTDANGNYVFALPIKTLKQTVDGYAYAQFDGAHDDQFLSSQFMTIFRPAVGGYLLFSQSGELLYQAKTAFEAQYTQQVVGLQIGTTASTAMAGNKVPTTTQRGGVLQQAAEANLAAQTVTDIATAQTAVNNIVTKLNSLLTKLKAGGELA
ncbi:Decoration protein [Enterobacter sp. DE0047]|uniref:Decoration protein n=1 Tax=Enterobacter sp. DE0047 TaxID=2584949 RepID=UPI0011A9AE2D|nr:Decoration protein [Enterobacter sp. DE0047]